MFTRLIVATAVAAVSASSGFAQAPGGGPAATEVPGVAMPSSPDAAGATSLPGVSDPVTTNSTTGTANSEDHCQPPGTPNNTNPSAEVTTIPRAEGVCQ